MTDKEICKMLDRWSLDYGCTGCPFIEQGCFDCGHIPIEISKSILNLINRQQAEINDLRRNAQNWASEANYFENMVEEVSYEKQLRIEELEAEIERLKRENKIYGKMLSEAWERIEELDKLNETVKNKAIKEFVKEHKEIMRAFTNENLDFEMKWAEYEANTDNLAKEMVGTGNEH